MKQLEKELLSKSMLYHFFCKFIVLILGYNLPKLSKKNKFEDAWGELKAKNCFLFPEAIMDKIFETNFSFHDCNGIRIHNHLVCKRTLNHLAKLAK